MRFQFWTHWNWKLYYIILDLIWDCCKTHTTLRRIQNWGSQKAFLKKAKQKYGPTFQICYHKMSMISVLKIKMIFLAWSGLLMLKEYIHIFYFLIFNLKKKRKENAFVHIFWEDHKILRNLHLTFDWHYIGQK